MHCYRGWPWLVEDLVVLVPQRFSQWRIRKHHTVRDYWLIATRPEKYLDRIGRAGVFLYDGLYLSIRVLAFGLP